MMRYAPRGDPLKSSGSTADAPPVMTGERWLVVPRASDRSSVVIETGCPFPARAAQAPAECCDRDRELRSGTSMIAAVAVEGGDHVLEYELVERLHSRRTEGVAHGLGQVVETDSRSRGNGAGVLECMFQFTHVSRPAVVQDPIERLGREVDNAPRNARRCSCE